MNMIFLLVSVLVIILVLGLVALIVQKIVPEPWRNIALAIVGVIACLLLLSLLISPFPAYHSVLR